jgi:hypothetical protein
MLKAMMARAARVEMGTKTAMMTLQSSKLQIHTLSWVVRLVVTRRMRHNLSGAAVVIWTIYYSNSMHFVNVFTYLH